MADTEKRTRGGPRISERERFRYIGFDVFPGKPKDLFKNDAEKDRYVEGVRDKRASDHTLRDKCTLLEERVSTKERIILTVASLVMLAALFLPWYSAYVEVAKSAPVKAEPDVVTEVDAVQPDSLGDQVGDSIRETPATEQVIAEDEPEQAAPAQPAGAMTHAGQRANQEIITGRVQRQTTVKHYSRLTGLGTFAALGNVGGKVFSSGFVLMLSGVLMLVLGLLCILLPVLNLYGIYGLQGTPDQKALRLKRLLRFNWLPLAILLAVFVLAFFGASYGFDATKVFASLGDSYTIGTLFNSLSWGLFIALAASILVAAKGIEI